ncbi:hypothetical protein BFJ68_g211 [Fusarium oxysporum]|uniref:Uncharacterized protein n=2 Tax=Fusarium oxysporum TaxID=5507 RepID=A0A420S8E0_FUSOX|nr:hypothetical protein BFJ65_g10872 [Fusarium oxysporum f. sp. cepae]RKK56163.1 hypothetical protein BFJ66_g3780 [Fusarium oxysporum f. sp. cepae]RKK59976.1 hypothetical protein BFJ67_g2310 [Fusarium oxysporum f. sp. cepae]RKL07558.1 hypothetical protein BFJ71_g2160 [Fusarium oxysporum]RKL25576.1 hypothetical protein BFJ68_g211 [Fusarium oxysporum]
METGDTQNSSDIRDCYDCEGTHSRIAASILDTRPSLAWTA